MMEQNSQNKREEMNKMQCWSGQEAIVLVSPPEYCISDYQLLTV